VLTGVQCSRCRSAAFSPAALSIGRQIYFIGGRGAEFLLFQWCERQGASAGVDSCAMAPLVFGNAAAARMRTRKGSGDAESERERGGF